jgi:outer membrane protein assembly factor BamB
MRPPPNGFADDPLPDGDPPVAASVTDPASDGPGTRAHHEHSDGRENEGRELARRRVLAATTVSALGTVAGCLDGSGGESTASAAWPMRGYDARRTNHRASTSVPGGDLEVRWQLSMDSYATQRLQPIAYDDAIVFVDDGVTAVDRRDGSVRFHVDGPSGALALADAQGYRTPTLVAGDESGVTGFDATGGLDLPWSERIGERWQRSSRDTSWSSSFGPTAVSPGRTPVVADGVLYHASRTHAVVSRDPGSGRERWHADSKLGTNWFAVGEHAYLSTYGDGVRALDRADGSTVWHQTDLQGPGSGVATADGVVYLNDARGLSALDAADGSVDWSRRPDGLNVDYGVPTVTDDRVVLAGFDGVFGFDRETGEHVWTRALETPDRPHLTAAGDVVFVPTPGEGLVALDATTGRTAWTYEGPGAHQSTSTLVADGRVYVASIDELVCLEGSA